MKLDGRYTDYFPEYSNYFGRSLRLLKSVYGMNNSGKIFADELAEWLLEAGLIQSRYQISIYYKYVPYGTKIVVLSYVDDFVYWYNSEALGKHFVDDLGNIFYVKFFWDMHIRSYQSEFLR